MVIYQDNVLTCLKSMASCLLFTHYILITIHIDSLIGTVNNMKVDRSKICNLSNRQSNFSKDSS